MTNVVRRLEDVVRAIEAITRHTTSEQEFRDDELVQVWAIHHIQMIGEACSSIDRAWRDAHDEVPWREIIGMRQVLVHRYWRVDIDLIWSTIQRDIPALHEQIVAILNDLSEEE